MTDLTEAQYERLRELESDIDDIKMAILDIRSDKRFTKDNKSSLEESIHHFLVTRLAMNQEGDIRIPPLSFSKIWNQKLQHMNHQDLKP